jgi:histidinol-phosphate aminotransferase
VEKFVRDTIKNLIGYETKNTPYTYKLDANEGRNLFFTEQEDVGVGDCHRYPDNEATQLRMEVANYLNMPVDNILAGNGSSEMIELLLKTFIDQGDGVLSFTPSFSMYDVFTQIYGGTFIGVPSHDNYKVNIDLLIKMANEKKPKVIFICNPNNPTGTYIAKDDIERIIKETECIVVVDEAYVEFAKESFVTEINNYDNVIVLRTVSKAFGLASIRLGFMVANEAVIDVMKKVKPPYNLNAISQIHGIKALKNKEKMETFVATIKTEREILFKQMKELGIDVYPSEANFLFFKSKQSNLAELLQNRGILIRKFSGDLEGFYRVSVGLKEENMAFIQAVKEILTNA